MDHRPLGRTGLTVRPISFGAFKIGRNEKTKYARGYALPTDSEVERLLNGLLDIGINLIDTAPAYGTSEERIGKAISHRRRDFILSTKVGETFEEGQSIYDFSRPAVLASIQRSLNRLKTEVLDFVFVHSDGRDLDILRQTDVVPALQQARQAGWVRFIGMSGKTAEGATASLSWADALMVEYHPQDVSHGTVMTEASRAGVAVLVKKPLASGTLSPEEAIPFILAQPEVATLVVGGLNLDHIQQNLAIARQCR